MSNEIKVGITVLLATIVAIVGFRFMRDVPIFQQSLEIYTTFDRVDGISPGSLVNISGVKAGSVSDLELQSGGDVRVQLRIDSDIRIPRGSVANLTSLGIVEGKSIVISLGDSEESVQHGDEIEGVYVEGIMEAVGQQAEDLGEGVSSSVAELNLFLTRLNETLDEDTRLALGAAVQNSASVAEQVADLLEEKENQIGTAIESASRTLSQLDTLTTENRPRIDSLMVSLEQNINELSAVQAGLQQATASLNQILEKINRGEGTIGRLVNDPAVYDNLDSLSREMNILMKNINEDPARYLKHMSIIDIF